MGLVDVKLINHTGCKVVRRTHVATLQQSTRQDAQPPLDLIEPRAMFGGKVEPMRMRWIAQEGPPVYPPAQLLLDERDIAPRGNKAADVETPVRIEMIDHPIVTRHGGPLAHAVGQMGRAVRAGAGAPEVPHQLPRRHDEGRDQGACPMANVRVRTFLRLPRLRGLRGLLPLQNLHAGLCIRADHPATVLGAVQGVAIQLAHVPRLRVKRGIVAIEPIHAAMRFAIRCCHNPLEARATHEPAWMLLPQDAQQVVETPARGPTVGICELRGGHRQDIDLVRGGKSAAADLSVAHPAARRAPARDSAGATGARCGDHRASRRRLGDWADGRVPRPAGSADNGTPRLGGWNARGRATLTGSVPRPPTSLGEHKGLA